MTKIQHQTIKLPAVIPVLLTAILFFAGCGNKQHEYSVKVIMVNNHWIYTIEYGNKTIIRQETMPGINSISYFPDRETAMRTAMLVRHRLNRCTNPSISAQEMDSILRIGHHKL